jgi:prevent-host-death family protein
VRTHIAIGQVKRDISELVNRVAYGGERIVLTSRGRPKAALVSMDDYRMLERRSHEERLTHWRQWLKQSERFGQDLLANPQDHPLDVDALLEAAREERDNHDDRVLGR